MEGTERDCQFSKEAYQIVTQLTNAGCLLPIRIVHVDVECFLAMEERHGPDTPRNMVQRLPKRLD